MHWLEHVAAEDRGEIEDWFEGQDHDCMDNYRVALLSDDKQVANYDDARDRGCCGSVDEEITVNGRTYAVGFNYGH